MKLSDKIEYWRAERPDEWTMDELARQARLLEDALLDARSGLRYVRSSYPDVTGVGYERVEEKAKKGLEE